jgi:hypothetical protein
MNDKVLKAEAESHYKTKLDDQNMRKYIFTIAFCCLATFTIKAQESSDNLAQQAANPIADLMSFPFQNNLNMNQGPYNRNTNVLNIQPVIPLLKGRLITRTIIPIVSIPDYSSEDDMHSSGLSDIIFTAFYTPATQGLTWGVGPVLEMPTGGSLRGTEKWSIGPSVVLLVQPEEWTFGLLANNTWSFAGNPDRGKVNHMLLNLFVVRQLGKGWYVNSAPIITADWTKEQEDRWIVPLGLGGGKLVFLGGKLPLNIQSQLYYNVIRPDSGPEWQWRFQAQVLLPTSIFGGN